MALKKRSDDLLCAEKWAESEAAARRILQSGSFSFERAQPLINVLGAMGRLDEMIELQAQVMKLEPQSMFVSRDQQWNLYMAGRFEALCSERSYQRLGAANRPASHERCGSGMRFFPLREVVLAEGSELTLLVRDDGIGCTLKREGMGTRLIRLLAQQLGASVAWEKPEVGCQVRIALSATERRSVGNRATRLGAAA